MSIFLKVCRICELTRFCTVSFGMVLLILWGLWGWGMLTYWYFDDAPVAFLGQGTISDTVVKPYQSVVARVPFSKYRSCKGVATRYLTGNCGHYVLSTVPTLYEKGFSGEIVYPFTIPDSIASGNCAFKVQVTYRCNLFDDLLQRQTFISPPVSFKVQR